MNWRLCAALAACAVFAALRPASAGPPDEGAELVKMVVLERHGVRSPTQSPPTLAQWSRRDWPNWPVGPGRLTPRGAALVKRFWEQEGEALRRAGLLPEAKPSARAREEERSAKGEGAEQEGIFFYADRDERTQATAEAALDGLAPHGGLFYARYPYHGPDPLFHPVEAGYCALDPVAVDRELSPAVLAELERSLAGPIERVAEVLGAASPELCRAYGLSENCTIADVPSRVRMTKENRGVHVDGKLGMAGSAAEIFLLEYAEWDRDAGWGRVDAANLESLLPVHSRTFDAINRAPSVAAARGSELLLCLANALAGREAAAGVEKSRLVVFVGHDTNIAAVSGLLELHWRLPGYAPDEIPPGSALALSLWRRGERWEVRAQFIAQSLETLHDPAMRGELLRQDLDIPWCNPRVGASPCLLTDFELMVRDVIRPDCVRER